MIDITTLPAYKNWKKELRDIEMLLNNSELTKRPYGCKCQTLHRKLSGDGCDECNPELANEWVGEE